MKANPRAAYFFPGTSLPWGGQFDDRVVLLVPIVEDTVPRGGIYLVRYRDPGAIESVMPAAQSLAAQIASALRRAEIYQQTLAHQRVEHELALAGRIQKSFLPLSLPEVPGWQIVASLDPARQTSGDFYDLFPLPDGTLAIVVADVADKGVGAALYMALSRTLIRTYALEHPHQPERVMKVTNDRILADTSAGLFVTVFYAVLNPETGELCYCNAGHNPPYFAGLHQNDGVAPLNGTGMALGVLEHAGWKTATVHFAPGDLLVLYTDGVTDAQDADGSFFGKERLQQVVKDCRGCCPETVQAALIGAVRDFVGGAEQFDDITLMVVGRNLTKS